MLGDKLKEMRLYRHITQKEMAEKTGLATITIQGYEANKFKPKLETLEKIAKALDTPIAYFFSDMTPSDITNYKQDLLFTTLENVCEASKMAQSEKVPYDYLVGRTNISDLDEYALKTFSKVVSEENITTGLSVYDYPINEIASMRAYIGHLFLGIEEFVWNGKGAIKHKDFDSIYLCGKILSCFFNAAAKATIVEKAIEMDKADLIPLKNNSDNNYKKQLSKELLEKITPLIDMWIENYLHSHRTMPRYSKEINDYFEKKN